VASSQSQSIFSRKVKKFPEIQIMHWTCENSLETDLFPEQVDPYTGEGKSVAPLTWSHTTFIKTALMYSNRKQEIKK
jgi:GH15 family glucan-1,4-alpha-glucosidase